MREVSTLLSEWDPNFRAIIAVDGDVWLQNRSETLPLTTQQIIDAWNDAEDQAKARRRRLAVLVPPTGRPVPATPKINALFRQCEFWEARRFDLKGKMVQALRRAAA